jgi:hypothetical protein
MQNEMFVFDRSDWRLLRSAKSAELAMTNAAMILELTARRPRRAVDVWEGKQTLAVPGEGEDL